MNKKIIGILLSMGIVILSNNHTYSEKFDMKSWYNEYIEQEYIKETMFNRIDTLNEEYNLDAKYLEPIDFEITFYTDLNCENGFGPVNSLGERLEDGMVANNFLEFGTQIYIPNMGLKTVKDRGSKKHFTSVNRIDVFVPRKNGETDDQYYNRVNSLGRQNIKGYIIK